MLLVIEVNECRLSVSLNVYLETSQTNQNFVNEKKMGIFNLENVLLTFNTESSVIQFAGRIFLKSYISVFSKICRVNSSFIKIW
jgi:hypothetical protein